MQGLWKNDSTFCGESLSTTAENPSSCGNRPALTEAYQERIDRSSSDFSSNQFRGPQHHLFTPWASLQTFCSKDSQNEKSTETLKGVSTKEFVDEVLEMTLPSVLRHDEPEDYLAYNCPNLPQLMRNKMDFLPSPVQTEHHNLSNTFRWELFHGGYNPLPSVHGKRPPVLLTPHPRVLESQQKFSFQKKGTTFEDVFKEMIGDFCSEMAPIQPDFIGHDESANDQTVEHRDQTKFAPKQVDTNTN